MAVTLTGNGGLFTRLGKLFGLAKTVRQHQQAIAPTSGTATSGIRNVYSVYASTTGTLPQATDLVQAVTDEDAIARSSDATLNMIQAAARRTVIEMVDADTKLPAKTLNEALRELAFQMNRDSQSVARSLFTVGTASYGGSNIGDAVVVVSCEATKIIRDQVTFTTKLVDFPCVRTETLTFRCVDDSRMGARAAGSELWHVIGDRSFPNLDRRWRAGSGALVELEQTCASTDGYGFPMAGRNVLTNSSFEIFTSNLPDRWEASVGTAGTHFRETTTHLRGTYGLEFVGNGSTLAAIRQKLGSVDGTHGRIKSDTLYLISFWAKDDGTAPAAGAIRVSLQDGSGSILGGNMSAVATVTSGYSNWTLVRAAIVSPVNIPETIYVVVEQSTAVSAGRSIFVDEVTICEMKRLAPGGPAVAIVAAEDDSRRGDFATVAITASEVGEMNLELDRFFGLYESGIVLPSSTGTNVTVADSLIS